MQSDPAQQAFAQRRTLPDHSNDVQQTLLNAACARKWKWHETESLKSQCGTDSVAEAQGIPTTPFHLLIL